MKFYPVELNSKFIGRTYDLSYLTHIETMPEAHILIVYGRRRIGKTELLEQAFRNRNLLKFEGQETLSPKLQMQFVMQQLAKYAENPLLAKIQVSDWVEVLEYIADVTKKGVFTIYFEELQWLANYDDHFISALKYVWDNLFRRNPKLIIILCGSSPSFMINHVIKSRALYNRSQYELPMREFNLIEAKSMLHNHSLSEILDAYLIVGGMPEYLKRLTTKNSVFINLAKESFLPGAFFATEYERIFTSSLANNKNYKKIIEYLSKRKFATRQELQGFLKIKSGGGLTEVLDDLKICGFIECYSPYDKPDNSLNKRYCIADAYLQYYFKFIKPLTKAISDGDYIDNPLQAINMTIYQQWLGYAFERFCRKYQKQIANLLGFSAVHYRSGSYFNRKNEHAMPGYQIDLLFDRDDKVLSICEIKYSKNRIPLSVIEEFSEKLELFQNSKNKTIQRVLITNQSLDERMQSKAYFDRIITIEDLFQPTLWS